MLPNTSLTAVLDALAASPLPTAYIDRSGVYRFVNRAYERWLGQSWDDVVGKTTEQVMGAKAAEAVQYYADAALSGGTVEFETSLPYRTRGVRRMKIVYAAAREPDETVPGYFAFLEDITVRYDADSAVAAALDGMADGYFALDRHFRFTYVNSAAARLYGMKREQMLDRSIEEVFPGALNQPTGELVKEVIATGNPKRRELPSAGRPGDVFVFDVMPLMTGGVGVVIQDVSEQRRREAELRLANRRFKAAARASQGLIYEWDPVSNVVWRSAGVREVFGVEPEEVEPTTEWWSERMHPDDRLEASAYLDDMREVVERTYRVRYVDGSWRRVLDRAVAIRDDNGDVVRVIGLAVALPGES